jgi:F0F1-type ATP synthase membrane subunit c/vacuolar-type H+-ATPase subunit K
VGIGVEVGAGVLAGSVATGETVIGVGTNVAGTPVAVAIARVGAAVGVGDVAGRTIRLCATQPTPQASAPKSTSATTSIRI